MKQKDVGADVLKQVTNMKYLPWNNVLNVRGY